MTSLAKLLDISSPSLATSTIDDDYFTPFGERGAEIKAMLAERNGLYAMESALHVFPYCGDGAHAGGDLVTWNAASTWKEHYQHLPLPLLCFAEDIFGGQFATDGETIQQLDPETGELTHFADDVEGWAYAILDDYEVHTGYPLAHSWQKGKGRIAPGQRLIPVVPFVLGGEFKAHNMRAVPAVAGMHHRAAIANQIHDLPDGAKINIDVVDHIG